MNQLISFLVILIMISILSVFLKYSIGVLKNRTQINQLFILSFIFFGFGILSDLIRILEIIFLGTINENIDKIVFILKVFLYFFGTSTIIYIMQILSRQSGHHTKKDTAISTSYYILNPFISILNSYTFIKTNINEYGFYFFQINPFVFLLTLAILSPLFAYVFFKVKVLKSEIKSELTRKQVDVCITAFILIEINCTTILIFYSLFNNSIYILITNLLILLTSTYVFTFSLFRKYPDFLNAVSTYYSIRSIYIIGGKGVIIYEYDFQKESLKDPLSTRELLLGGFLYIIDSGLVTLFDAKEDIKSINIGNMNLIFTHGKYVFGLLLTTDYTFVMARKLNNFVEKFENNYKNILENWSGEITEYNSEIIQNWIDEFFR